MKKFTLLSLTLFMGCSSSHVSMVSHERGYARANRQFEKSLDYRSMTEAQNNAFSAPIPIISWVIKSTESFPDDFKVLQKHHLSKTDMFC